MVAQGVGDDGCWHVPEVLADRGCAAVRVGTPSLWMSAARVVGCIGCLARRPGNSHREWGLVAVFMLSRSLIQARRSCANGVGTGEGGSPRRSMIWSPSQMIETVRIRGRSTARVPGNQPDYGQKQQMLWSPTGAQLFLRVRTAVLNNDLAGCFRRWYPGFTHGGGPAEIEVEVTA